MKKKPKNTIVMTDEQIEQGLSCCSAWASRRPTKRIRACVACPYNEKALAFTCIGRLASDSLEYLKRLKERDVKPDCYCTNNMPADCDGCKLTFECSNPYRPRWDCDIKPKEGVEK